VKRTAIAAPLLLRLWLLCFLVATTAGACRDREPPAPAPEDTAPAPTPAPPDRAPPATPFAEIARYDCPGLVFTLAYDGAHAVVAATRGGPAMLCGLDATATGDALPARLELLDDFAGAVTSLGDALFAALQVEAQRLLLLHLDLTQRPQRFVELLSLPVEGTPAAAAFAAGRLWLLVRGTTDGRGLMAIDPVSGEVRARLSTGPSPVALTVTGQAPHQALRVVTIDTEHPEEEQGQILRLAATASSDDEVQRSAIRGWPVALQPGDLQSPTPSQWLLRHTAKELLEITPSGVPGATLTLPALPMRVLQPTATTLYALSPEGQLSLARFDGQRWAVAHSAEVGVGSVELAWVAPYLLLLDGKGRKLSLRHPETLAEIATHPLDGAPGRLLYAPKLHRAFVTLPDRQQIVAVMLDPDAVPPP